MLGNLILKCSSKVFAKEMGELDASEEVINVLEEEFAKFELTDGNGDLVSASNLGLHFNMDMLAFHGGPNPVLPDTDVFGNLILAEVTFCPYELKPAK